MNTVAVLGGGLMGSGIATACLTVGIKVILKEVNDKFLQVTPAAYAVPLCKRFHLASALSVRTSLTRPWHVCSLHCGGLQLLYVWWHSRSCGTHVAEADELLPPVPCGSYRDNGCIAYSRLSSQPTDLQCLWCFGAQHCRSAYDALAQAAVHASTLVNPHCFARADCNVRWRAYD